ncbi:PAS domain-containing protein [bacterium]|nr:PAS domain-containing protein [bacterium]
MNKLPPLDDVERIKRELEKTKNESSQVFDATSAAIRIIDRHFRVLRANEAMRRLCGLSEGEIKSSLCYEQFKSSLCNTPKCPLKEMEGKKEVKDYEIIKETPSKKNIHCILTVSPYKDLNGNLIGIIEDFRDIGKFKQTEEDFNDLSMEVSTGLHECTKTIQRLSQADATTRIAEVSKNKMIRGLEAAINKTVEELSQTISKKDELNQTLIKSLDAEKGGILRLTKEKNELSEKLQELSAKFNQITAERDEFSLKLQEVFDRVNQITTERDNLSTKLQESLENTSQITAEKDEFSQRSQELSDRVSQIIAERDEFSVKLQESLENISQITAERDELSCEVQKISQITIEKNELSGKLQETFDRVSQITAEKDEFSQRSQELLARVDQITAEKDEFSQRLQELSAKFNQITAERDELSCEVQKVSQITVERDELFGKLKEAEESIRWMEREKIELSERLQESLEKLTERDGLSVRSQELLARVDQITRERDELIQKVSQSRTKLEELVLGKRIEEVVLLLKGATLGLTEKSAEILQSINDWKDLRQKKDEEGIKEVCNV